MTIADAKTLMRVTLPNQSAGFNMKTLTMPFWNDAGMRRPTAVWKSCPTPIPYHPFHRLNRSAFPMTIMSEKPIAAAHRTGLMKPSAARGIPAAL